MYHWSIKSVPSQLKFFVVVERPKGFLNFQIIKRLSYFPYFVDTIDQVEYVNNFMQYRDLTISI
jgi:hypothetical protein